MLTFPLATKVKALFAGCFLLTTTLFANPTNPANPASFNTSLYVTKANKIHLAIEKTTVEPVTITLRPMGVDQPYVYRKLMNKKQAKMALRLDVSDLVDGVYVLEIKSATSQLTRQIELATPVKQTEVVRTIVVPVLPDKDAVFSVK